MKYYSTRNNKIEKNFQDIVMGGLSPDKGLYLPKSWPKVNYQNLKGLNYDDLAFEIIYPFCTKDINEEDLRNILNITYKKFHHPKTAPLIKIDENKYILELFYGPTFAFKDYALQFLGNLFEYFLNKEQKNLTIIGATSGDTGSAAIEACRLKKNIDLFILYPHNKISEVQRRQMTTVKDNNIHTIALKGNFDDCQKIVKNLFVDRDLMSKTRIGAVNSINWARIVSQSVYYYWAILQLKEVNRINFIVPSGNFGNVYAGHIATKMGLPIDRLHVVTNANDILYRSITNGRMKLKNVKKTYSPSMDIQISSNFERQLFESVNCDSNILKFIMDNFLNKGEYNLDKDVVEELSKNYSAYSVNDKEILNTIKQYFDKYKYLADPHTATGLNILEKISNKNSIYISLACAHPSKFSEAIVKATKKEPLIPDTLKNIFEKKEKITILNNNLNDIKEYILSKI